ncbi:MAG: YajD family HNH nuclease [Myxococcota bacterium]
MPERGEFDYRRAALALLPHVCGHCGRAFEGKALRLLTVHHKDGDHLNNARDGSNWELLCVYCHDNEHARDAVAAHLAPEDPQAPPVGGSRLVSLADQLDAALKGRRP